MVWLLQDKWYDDEDYTVTAVCEIPEVAMRFAAEQVQIPGGDLPVLEWRNLNSTVDPDNVLFAEYVDEGHNMTFIIDQWEVIK